MRQVSRITTVKVLCAGVLLLLMALMAALFGFGFAYPSLLTPKGAAGQFRAIAGDGWIQTGSEMTFPDLASRGNRLLLEFNYWRPPGQPPAQLRVSVCGKVASEFGVSEGDSKKEVFLTGECNPRRVAFQVLNPFRSSENDDRELGVQLNVAEITSKLHIPLLNPRKILLAASAVALLALILWSTLRAGNLLPGVAPVMLLAVPVVSFVVLSRADASDVTKLSALWLLCTSLCAGMTLAGWAGTKALFPEKSGMARHLTMEAGALRGALVLAIVAAGGALRFYGLRFGLPFNYHPDEVPKVNAIMTMVANDTLNPNYFLHPSLLIYSTYFLNKLFHWFGMEGSFRETAFIAGRTVSALAGTVSIYFIYVIAKRLFSSWTGVIAAAGLAVYPLHVTCSRYMKEDALLTCMGLACVAALLKAVQEDRKGFLLLAGFMAGVSASSKYTGMLMVAVVASAPWLRARRVIPDFSWFGPTIVALAFAPLGFVTCTPYSILNSSKFLNDFGSEQRHMMRGHTIPVDPWSQYWMYHLWRSILPGMNLFTTVLGMAGIGLLLWRRRIEDLFVVGMVLLFYLPAEWVKAKPEPQPERYILPCLPFLGAAAGELLRVLKGSHLRLAAVLLAVFMIALPAKRSVELASEVRYDTRDAMRDWMIQNLPKGSKVYLDWKPYAPRFSESEFSVVHIPRARILEKLKVKALKESGFDYLVLSGLFYERYFTQPLAEAGVRQVLREVFERVPIVTEKKAKLGTYGFHNPMLTLFSLKPDDFASLEAELELRRKSEIPSTSNQKKSSFRWFTR